MLRCDVQPVGVLTYELGEPLSKFVRPISALISGVRPECGTSSFSGKAVDYLPAKAIKGSVTKVRV